MYFHSLFMKHYLVLTLVKSCSNFNVTWYVAEFCRGPGLKLSSKTIGKILAKCFKSVSYQDLNLDSSFAEAKVVAAKVVIYF